MVQLAKALLKSMQGPWFDPWLNQTHMSAKSKVLYTATKIQDPEHRPKTRSANKFFFFFFFF